MFVFSLITGGGAGDMCQDSHDNTIETEDILLSYWQASSCLFTILRGTEDFQNDKEFSPMAAPKIWNS